MLCGAAVADGETNGSDPAVDRGLGDDTTLPYPLDQFRPRNYPGAIFKQVHEQIKNLRFNADYSIPSHQLAPIDVKQMITENISHGRLPLLPAVPPTKSRKSPGGVKRIRM